MKTSEVRGFLKDKVAVITGAARGIGRAAAIAFAREGASVVGIDICGPVFPRSGVTSSTPEDLEETGRMVKDAGARWLAITLDQRNSRLLRDAASLVRETFGGIDILFANAGIQAFKPLLEMDDEDWGVQIDVNLNGTANAIRAFAPHIIERGGGSIIVTSSTQGQHGTLNGAAYSASKWGILGLMKSAALELGPHHVTVNALIPGLIDTPLTRHKERYEQVLQDAHRQAADTEIEDVAKTILAGRLPLGVPWIAPEDVAPMVVFLASDAARMVSGAVFEVTGGDSARNAV